MNIYEKLYSLHIDLSNKSAQTHEKNATDSRLRTLRQSFFFQISVRENVRYAGLSDTPNPKETIPAVPHSREGRRQKSLGVEKERMESMITTNGEREREKEREREREREKEKEGKFATRGGEGRSEEKKMRERDTNSYMGTHSTRIEARQKNNGNFFFKNRDRFPLGLRNGDEMKEIMWSGKKGTPRELAAQYVFSKTNSEHLPFQAGGQSRSIRDGRNYLLSKK